MSNHTEDNLFADLECLSSLEPTEEIRLQIAAELSRARKPERQVGLINALTEITGSILTGLSEAEEEFEMGTTLFEEEQGLFELRSGAWIERYGSRTLIPRLELAKSLMRSFDEEGWRAAEEEEARWRAKHLELMHQRLVDSTERIEGVLRDANALDEVRLAAARQLGITEVAEELRKQLGAHTDELLDE